jgi:hypothetical protein
MGIPEVSKGGSYLRIEMMISHRTKVEVEEVVPKGRTLEYMPPQQQIPQRRGWIRKNKEVGETQIQSKLCARSVAEQLVMHVIHLEPVKVTIWGSDSRTRRTYAMDSNI